METEEEILPDILEFYISQIDILIEMGDARAFTIIKNVQANILEKIKEWKPNIKHL